jgi:hypothetical protein
LDKTANAKVMLCDGWLTQYRVSLDAAKLIFFHQEYG